jgi:hypothetical protein
MILEEHYSVLEDFHWTSADGVRRHPARGEMNHRHIYNVMRFLELRCHSRIHRSRLHESNTWKALQKGLELPDPGEYEDQNDDWQLGLQHENYTVGEHKAYLDWSERKRI